MAEQAVMQVILWGVLSLVSLDNLVWLWLRRKAEERLDDCEAELETLRGRLNGQRYIVRSLQHRLDELERGAKKAQAEK